MSEKKQQSQRRHPNPIDVHVGSRIRLRRMMVGMSQEKLSENLGLTFQQIQKYEKGANRVGASRLYELAKILEVPVTYFYEDLPETEDNASDSGFAESDQQSFVMEFLNSREGLELNKAFTKINNPQLRKHIVDLVRTMAENDNENIQN